MPSLSDGRATELKIKKSVDLYNVFTISKIRARSSGGPINKHRCLVGRGQQGVLLGCVMRNPATPSLSALLTVFRGRVASASLTEKLGASWEVQKVPVHPAPLFW